MHLAYERARETISDFLDLRPDDELIFTRNTTDSMNLLARCVPPGTTVIVWDGEHHASLLPWSTVVRLPAAAAQSMRCRRSLWRCPLSTVPRWLR